MSSQATLTPSAAQVSAPEFIMQIGTGYILSATLYAVTELNAADLLVKGPRTVAELATATKAKEESLYRALRSLAQIGIFEEVAPRKFALTPPAEHLRSDHPQSCRPMILWMADPFHFKLYAETLYSVRTEEAAMERVFGASAWDFLRQNPEESEVFNRAMTNFSATTTPAVLEADDFSGIKTLVDVGGGHGLLLTSILRKYPGMRGVVCDLDHVVDGAAPESKLNGRCNFVAGDMFKDVPPGDAYIMKHILHDWDDDRAGAILRTCRRALDGRGKVIVLETVIEPGNQPHFGKTMDIEMLLAVGGRERTKDEFAELFKRTGFRLTRVVPTKSIISVIEGEAA